MSRYIDYVNVKLGTDSQHHYGNGNTQPWVAVPNAMSYWAIQTSPDRGSWFYHPKDRSFDGIRLSHLACNWLGDYGQLLFLPQTGEPMFRPACRWSSFRPNETVIRPDYMKVTALRYRYTLELAPTDRCAIMRVKFKNMKDTPRFTVFPFDCESEVMIENGVLIANSRKQDWRSSENFACYCAVRFDCKIKEEETVLMSDKGNRKGTSGKGCAINLTLDSSEFTVRIGTSFISYEQALYNLESEVSGDFESVRAVAEKRWEEKLALIEIEAEEERKRVFYSNMHRFFLYPSKFHETDKNGKIVHYCPFDGKIREGKMYVNNGFWDTARTVYPMLSLLDPNAFAEMLEGFVQIYKDSGWLPKWPSPGETGLMPGTYIDGVIADAAVKGIGSKELMKTAYEGMLKHATEEDPNRRFGRHGTADYNRLGYLPYDKYRECTNHTLDYVYGDFCISTVAGVMGEAEKEAFYAERAQNYKKLFDLAVGFIHSKDSSGKFKPDFNPIEWGGEYCEGSAWQNAFAVYHDVEGLADCYGGKEKFKEKLDELFSTPPDFDAGQYRYELHEMSEMAAIDFGQCAISNQPSFHLPYLYSKLGYVEESQYWLTRMVEEVFTAEDDGYPGDEDTGTMAAWYIFTTLGFYPVCPGKTEFTVGKAQVKKAVVHLGNGKELTVTSDGENTETDISLNGKKIFNVIDYQDLMDGGVLSFKK
ncbi:MAG: GH92 family glycosyl hydrolase [Clostridia bacterium]|nr:GH92 family glycosyl hydrolase [Clostridia bacterium]